MKVLSTISRRAFSKSLALIIFGVWAPVQSVAKAPPREKIDSIMDRNGLSNGTTAVLLDLQTNRILECHNKDLKLPLASVVKAVTAVYGVEVIGDQYSFKTDLFTDGKIKKGTLEGNLYLIGGGDPSLSLDDLNSFVDALKEKGINKISGDFFYESDTIPEFVTIDSSQLPQESFNPGFSGLNLNKNKVLFSWSRKGNDYDLTLQARDEVSKAKINSISISHKNRDDSSFDYVLETKNRFEKWIVSKKILGQKGMRWLPVRLTSTYTSFVFLDLLRRRKISVSAPRKLSEKIDGLKLLYRHKSKKLSMILKEMLDQSTNVTAEIIGVFAANFWGFQTPKLVTSASIMTRWFDFITKSTGNVFLNHSGLTDGSRVSSSNFIKFLSRVETKEVLLPLLKERKIYGPGRKEILDGNIKIIAKTGTMFFNRGLAGYITKDGQALAAFAIFSADINKKNLIKKHQLSNPPGSKKWLNQAKYLENTIIASWATYYI